MTRIESTEDLYQLLRRAHEGFVVWHNSCDVHAPGFAWIGADMSEAFRLLCERSYHARLLDIGLHRDGASAVSLTAKGAERLGELQPRRNQPARGVV